MSFFTAEQIAALSATTVRVDILAELQFVSNTVRVWNGNTDLVTGGHTWRPMFGMASIDGLGVSGGTVSESVTLTLNGLPNQDPDLLGLALEETPEADQQMCIVYLQLFDGDWQPVGNPIGVFWGFMQPPKVSRTPMQGTDGAIQSVTMAVENAFFNRSRPPNGRYTDRDQQRRSPGDKMMQFVPALLFKRIIWPDW